MTTPSKVVRAMQCTIRQRRHLECNSLRHAEPMKTDERVGDVVRLKAALLWHFVLTGDAGCE